MGIRKENLREDTNKKIKRKKRMKKENWRF